MRTVGRMLQYRDYGFVIAQPQPSSKCRPPLRKVPQLSPPVLQGVNTPIMCLPCTIDLLVRPPQPQPCCEATSSSTCLCFAQVFLHRTKTQVHQSWLESEIPSRRGAKQKSTGIFCLYNAGQYIYYTIQAITTGYMSQPGNVTGTSVPTLGEACSQATIPISSQ